jgi:hypothetical protein
MFYLYIFKLLFFLCTSEFKDLFNWKHFIDTLKTDVHIMESLPAAYAGIEPFPKTPISWSKVNSFSLCAEFFTHPKCLHEICLGLLFFWLLSIDKCLQHVTI